MRESEELSGFDMQNLCLERITMSTKAIDFAFDFDMAFLSFFGSRQRGLDIQLAVEHFEFEPLDWQLFLSSLNNQELAFFLIEFYPRIYQLMHDRPGFHDLDQQCCLLRQKNLTARDFLSCVRAKDFAIDFDYLEKYFSSSIKSLVEVEYTKQRKIKQAKAFLNFFESEGLSNPESESMISDLETFCYFWNEIKSAGKDSSSVRERFVSIAKRHFESTSNEEFRKLESNQQILFLSDFSHLLSSPKLRVLSLFIYLICDTVFDKQLRTDDSPVETTPLFLQLLPYIWRYIQTDLSGLLLADSQERLFHFIKNTDGNASDYNRAFIEHDLPRLVHLIHRNQTIIINDKYAFFESLIYRLSFSTPDSLYYAISNLNDSDKIPFCHVLFHSGLFKRFFFSDTLISILRETIFIQDWASFDLRRYLLNHADAFSCFYIDMLRHPDLYPEQEKVAMAATFLEVLKPGSRVIHPSMNLILSQADLRFELYRLIYHYARHLPDYESVMQSLVFDENLIQSLNQLAYKLKDSDFFLLFYERIGSLQRLLPLLCERSPILMDLPSFIRLRNLMLWKGNHFYFSELSHLHRYVSLKISSLLEHQLPNEETMLKYILFAFLREQADIDLYIRHQLSSNEEEVSFYFYELIRLYVNNEMPFFRPFLSLVISRWVTSPHFNFSALVKDGPCFSLLLTILDNFQLKIFFDNHQSSILNFIQLSKTFQGFINHFFDIPISSLSVLAAWRDKLRFAMPSFYNMMERRFIAQRAAPSRTEPDLNLLLLFARIFFSVSTFRSYDDLLKYFYRNVTSEYQRPEIRAIFDFLKLQDDNDKKLQFDLEETRRLHTLMFSRIGSPHFPRGPWIPAQYFYVNTRREMNNFSFFSLARVPALPSREAQAPGSAVRPN